MLTNDERQALRNEIDLYPTPRAASIGCLLKLQESRGKLSDETLADLALMVDVNEQELEAIATFYNRLHRRPIGRDLITYGDSLSCWTMGTDQIRAALEELLEIGPGETLIEKTVARATPQEHGGEEPTPALEIECEPHAGLSPSGLNEMLCRYL